MRLTAFRLIRRLLGISQVDLVVTHLLPRGASEEVARINLDQFSDNAQTEDPTVALSRPFGLDLVFTVERRMSSDSRRKYRDTLYTLGSDVVPGEGTSES